jgi:hypothetical protein
MTLRELIEYGLAHDPLAPMILPIGLMGLICAAGAVILGT